MGAYVPLRETPNATKVVDMPTAQYLDIPNIRYQPIPSGVNMGSRREPPNQGTHPVKNNPELVNGTCVGSFIRPPYRILPPEFSALFLIQAC
jgi:hypothetical protein